MLDLCHHRYNQKTNLYHFYKTPAELIQARKKRLITE